MLLIPAHKGSGRLIPCRFEDSLVNIAGPGELGIHKETMSRKENKPQDWSGCASLKAVLAPPTRNTKRRHLWLYSIRHPRVYTHNLCGPLPLLHC